jgi:hypothetical protein
VGGQTPLESTVTTEDGNGAALRVLTESWDGPLLPPADRQVVQNGINVSDSVSAYNGNSQPQQATPHQNIAGKASANRRLVRSRAAAAQRGRRRFENSTCIAAPARPAPCVLLSMPQSTIGPFRTPPQQNQPDAAEIRKNALGGPNPHTTEITPPGSRQQLSLDGATKRAPVSDAAPLKSISCSQNP